MDFSNLDDVHPDQLIVLLRAVRQRIYTHAQQTAEKVSRNVVRRYAWIAQEDLQQELMMRVDRWVAAFDDSHASKNPWSKYLYHKMAFYSKDVLRKEDPLGIGWPQRQHYPAWFRLGSDSSGVMGGDGESAAMVGADVPKEMLGKIFQSSADDPSNQLSDEDQQWADSLAAFQSWVTKQRKAQARRKVNPDPLPDAGSGVARLSRLKFWDHVKHRVTFRQSKSISIGQWLADRRVDKLQLLLFK